MSRSVSACAIWLVTIAACTSINIPGAGFETDSPLTRHDNATALPPILLEPSDAGVAADGGDQKPMGPASVMDPDERTELMLPETVRFEPPGGGFAGSLELQLSGVDSTIEVHYTLDGSLPSESSPLVDGPLTIEKTTLVRAVALRNGEPGKVVNHVYFRVDDDTHDYRTDLPVVVVDMQNQPAPDSNLHEMVDAVIGVFEPTEGTTILEAGASWTSRIGIKVRGRSTRHEPKRSYTLELRGAGEDEAPAPLLGMPSHADWVLYAPYQIDRTLMRNAFGYEVSRRIGRYAPRTRFCELFLVSGDKNGVAQASYRGIYVLTERIARGGKRVPVAKLDSDDTAGAAVTGGYIFQKNDPDPGDEPFAAAGFQFLFVHPKQANVQPEHREYISEYVESVVRAIKAPDGRDPETDQHYSKLVDVGAFIDHHILNVLFKNPDAFVSSSYFHKDRSGLLAAGPLWDLDVSLGSDDPFVPHRSQQIMQWNVDSDDVFQRSFLGPLFTHAEFEQAYWARWRELLAGPFEIGQLHSLIDDLERELAQAEPRNRKRWPKGAPRNDSYSEEVAAMRLWLEQRLAWINANVGTRP